MPGTIKHGRAYRLIHNELYAAYGPPTGPKLRQPDDPGTAEREALRSATRDAERTDWPMFVIGGGIGFALAHLVGLVWRFV